MHGGLRFRCFLLVEITRHPNSVGRYRFMHANRNRPTENNRTRSFPVSGHRLPLPKQLYQPPHICIFPCQTLCATHLTCTCSVLVFTARKLACLTPLAQAGNLTLHACAPGNTFVEIVKHLEFLMFQYSRGTVRRTHA